MEAPATFKDVHKLTGCMAALNRFISRLGERRLPFSSCWSSKTNSSGQRRQGRRCKISSIICSRPPSSQHHYRAKIYYFTLSRWLTWLAQPLWWSAMRKFIYLECSGRYISLAKYSLSPRFLITRQFRNISTQYSSHPWSSATTLTSTRSQFH